jgi:hypothetical protein
MTALLVAEWGLSARHGIGLIGQTGEIAAFVATLPVWLVVAKCYGLYDQDEERTDHSAADEFSGIFHMITICTAGVTVANYLVGMARPDPSKLLLFPRSFPWYRCAQLQEQSRGGPPGTCRTH